MSLIESLMKSTNNDFANLVIDGVVGDNAGFIDTGSYALNALLSGSIYGGIPSNKISAIAGESGVGKTYYALQIVKSFLDKDPNNVVIYFESESAIDSEVVKSRGIDPERMAIISVATVQEYRHQAVKVIEQYEADTTEKEREEPHLLIILDSLGNLSTTKEVEDMSSGAEKLDMTRSKLIRGAFRVLTLKCGKLNVPMLLTNHVYETQSMYSQTVMGGGAGLTYAASSVVFLKKAKEKDGTDVIGALITALLQKGRLTIEQKKVQTRLFYETGLDKYFGLVDIAIEAGIFEKISTKIKLPDGTTKFRKHIENKPANYFTDEILDQIDANCKKIFCYGSDLSGSAMVEEDMVEDDG